MKYVWVIEPIRRSGHRGTSGLNWWLNFVCWACAITDTPWVFLAETRTNFFDVGGVKRWWRGSFEGDDSFARVVPAVKKDDAFYVEFSARCDRYGHNMKLV